MARATCLFPGVFLSPVSSTVWTMDANYKISRSSLHIEVTDRLREMIYERSLQPGERIDELALSARLGTSRTPLREALKVLAHEGLVRLVPGRGAFVIELSSAEVESLFPVLGLLQSRCAGEAVRHQIPEDIVALDEQLARIEQAVTDVRELDYYRAVDAFHGRLQAMANNPWLTRSLTDLGHFLQMVRNLMPLPENRLRQSMAEYRTLMKAIHRGDAEAAEQVVYLQATAQQRAWRTHQAQSQAAVEAAGASAATGAHDSRTGQPADSTAAAATHTTAPVSTAGSHGAAPGTTTASHAGTGGSHAATSTSMASNTPISHNHTSDTPANGSTASANTACAASMAGHHLHEQPVSRHVNTHTTTGGHTVDTIRHDHVVASSASTTAATMGTSRPQAPQGGHGHGTRNTGHDQVQHQPEAESLDA